MVFGLIRDLFSRFPAAMAVTVAFMVGGTVMSSASIVTLAPIADLLLNPAGVSPLSQRIGTLVQSFGLPFSIWTLTLGLLLLTLAKSLFNMAAVYGIERARYAVLRELVVGTFADLFRAQWRFFYSRNQGALLNTFTGEVSTVAAALKSIASLLSNVIQILFLLAIPIYISWQVTLITIVTAAVLSFPFFLLSKQSYRLGRNLTAANNKVVSIIRESFGSAKLILGFALQSRATTSLSSAFEEHRGAAIRSTVLASTVPNLYDPLRLVVIIIAVAAARKLEVPLSESAVLLYSLIRVIGPLGSIAALRNSLSNYRPSYEQLEEICRDADRLRETEGTRQFTGIRDEIRVEGVSFAFPDRPETLTDISLSIPQGKVTAFVGKSGAGKSTLADMIIGFHVPTKGIITIDRIDLREFDLNSFRRLIGYVPQDAVLFDMTIRENLLWAKEDATDDQIRQACGRANAEEFILELPDGYETRVGDRGVALSGGQVQRLALARAMVRSPALLVLDEATSSIDTHSERLIQKAIDRISKQTTVIVIAHRLSTIVNADHIYVLDGGRLVEEGCYDDLIRKDGHFSRLARHRDMSPD